MKIPKKLKIGAHTIRVQIASLPDDNGKASWTNGSIVLADDVPASHREAALFHEILHFLNPTLADEPLGHAFLDSFAQQIYQVLSDNKMLR